MKIEIQISRKSDVVVPVILGEVSLVRQRKDAPGSLTFTILSDIDGIVLGTNVKLLYDGAEAFRGYIFKIVENGNITITAYDSLRYLKNKTTFQYRVSTLSSLVKTIAASNMLECGKIEDSGFVIPWRIERSKSYLDIIASAVDITFKSTGKLFCLYDSKGKLCLQNVESLRTKFAISNDTATHYDYQKSIDSDVYNSIVLISQSKKSGNKYYRAEDSESIKKLGLLQYSENIGLNINGAMTASSLLEHFSREHKSYRFSVPFGDINIRGGSIITVSMPLHDSAKPFSILVQKVVHRFFEGVHFMDIITE